MIAHASIDERGKANSGMAGDQTGKEVCCRGWYNANWNLVLRAESPSVREKMAAAGERLCKCNLVGYDQWQRNDLWDDLAAVNWDVTAFIERGKRTETDCSAFVTALAKIAGIEVKRASLGGGRYNAPVTQTMRAAFTQTGYFKALTDKKYLTSSDYLLRGDILVRESGHTAINLTDGEKAKSVRTSSGQLSEVAGDKKSVETIAQEVLDGKWGNAPERWQRLSNAGYDFAAVQAVVNRLISKKEQNTELLAMEVLAGQWGNEPLRSQLLRAAGYDADAVQAEVNRLLSKG